MRQTNAEYALYFHDMKHANKLMRVVDCYQQVYEGRIYRNSYDRVNIVSLNPHCGRHTEIYYHSIESVDVIGDLPPDLPPFFCDWDYY